MKTIEETLRKAFTESIDSEMTDEMWTGFKTEPMYKKLTESLKSYTESMIEEDRKDAAEKAEACLEIEGEFYNGELPYVDKSSITDRPLPDLK